MGQSGQLGGVLAPVSSHHLKPADLPLVADNRGGLQKSYLLDAGHQLFHIGVIPHLKRVALKVVDQINRHHRHSPQLIIGNNREGKIRWDLILRSGRFPCYVGDDLHLGGGSPG